MKKRRFPDSLVLIFAMIAMAQVLTYLLPKGEFDREGRSVIAGTYHLIEAPELPAWATLSSIARGMKDAADIIFLVFIVGGAIGVIRASGAIDALIHFAIRRFGARPVPLIIGMVCVFSLGSATIGMAEEYVPFVPILVTMCIALRMDAVVAIGMVYVGAGIGYACSALNPFTVLIAQQIAGLSATSGSTYRWILLPLFLAVGIHHLLRYARSVRRQPSNSLVADVDYSSGFHLPEQQRFSAVHASVLLVLSGGIGFFVWGVNRHDWYLGELGTIFFAVALIAAAIGRISPNQAAAEFCRGAAELTNTALLIGFARAILVVLQDGHIIDTIVHGIAIPLERLGAHAAVVGMFAVQCMCNLFIPSGSGQAFVTMPIMTPLAELVGLERQVAVLAYQFGDGITNMVMPTNYVLMGMLGLGRIPYQRWVRFISPLVVKLFLFGCLALFAAVAMGYR